MQAAVDAAAEPKGDAAAELPKAGAAFAAGAAAPPPKLKGFAGVDELVPNWNGEAAAGAAGAAAGFAAPKVKGDDDDAAGAAG